MSPTSNIDLCRVLAPLVVPQTPPGPNCGASYLRRGDHQYNSDTGTHALVTNILSQRFRLRDAAACRLCPSTHYTLTAADVQRTLWPGLKEAAERVAEGLASRALRRAIDVTRWSGPPILSRVFVEVLLDKKIRRGPLPSLKMRQERIHTIQASLSATDALRMALLIFPVRDRHPAKNDGQLPDLGETCTLLRLWAICRAMELAQTAFLKERSTLLARAMHLTISTAEHAQQVLEAILLPYTGQDIDISGEVVMRLAEAKVTGRPQRHTISARLQLLAQELDHFAVRDQEGAARLLLCLAQVDKSLAWLIEGLKSCKDLPVQLFAVCDARRYTCFDTDPEDDITDYADALKEIARHLGLTDLITLVSVEQLQEHCADARLATFLTNRAAIYEEKMGLYSPYERAREALLAITGRDAFLRAVDALDREGKVVHLVEPILHGRYHPRLVAYTQEYTDMPREVQAAFLSGIYDKQGDHTLEVLRQEVLWSAVRGAIQYIASYECNTKTMNRLGLDDLGLLIPGVVRLSIHTKPESEGQFPIYVGPSVHRTPWHGTASVRPRGQSFVLETKLSLELKRESYVPLFICLSACSEQHASHLTKMAQRNQPLLWLYPGTDLIRGDKDDDQDLASKLACLGWI